MNDEDIKKFIMLTEIMNYYAGFSHIGNSYYSYYPRDNIYIEHIKVEKELMTGLVRDINLDRNEMKRILREFERDGMLKIEEIVDNPEAKDYLFKIHMENADLFNKEYDKYRRIIKNYQFDLPQEGLNRFYEFLEDYVNSQIDLEKYTEKVHFLDRKIENLNQEFKDSVFDFSEFFKKLYRFLDLFNSEFNLLLSSIPLRSNRSLPVKIKVFKGVVNQGEIVESSYVLSSKYGLKRYKGKTSSEIPLVKSGPIELLYLESIKDLPESWYDEDKLEKAIELYNQLIEDFCFNKEYDFFFGKQAKSIEISENLRATIYLQSSYSNNIVFHLKGHDKAYLLFSNAWERGKDSKFYKEILNCWNDLYSKIAKENKNLNKKVDEMFSFLEKVKDENKDIRALRKLI